MVIGITETDSRYQNYSNWILGSNTDIEIIQLSFRNPNIEDVQKCDGIILSGGIDTHPKFYKNDRIQYPLAPEEFNEARDIFEINVFQEALKDNIPVLAICRGMQLVNIFLGGDLVQDLEESGKKDHRRHGEIDGKHEIDVEKNSLLYRITQIEKGSINSAHHQGLGKIAPDLKITAFSPDGVAEAAEWKDPSNKPFLLCVQWHPERLAQEQANNPFTKNIRTHFLEVIKK